jgi:hypothetical protein
VVDLPKDGNTALVGPVIRLILHTRLAPGDIDIFALLVDVPRPAPPVLADAGRVPGW